jgi:hypothetical protein
MAIDHNIVFQTQALPKVDLFGDMQKGMDFRKGVQKSNEDQKIQDAYKANTKIGPDGKPVLDRQASLAALYQINPQRAMQEEQSLMKMDGEKLRQQADMAKDLAWSVKDQDTWTHAKQRAAQYGLPGSDKLPDQYDPNFVKQLQYSTLTAKEQLDEKYRRDSLDSAHADRQASRDQVYAIADRTRGDRRDDVARREAAGDFLPPDKKKFVDTLATKNAGKVSIKNQIDATMANWDSLPEDQQIAAGRQLIKTLNSTEGADAVAVEEAKRLGGKLEFALGNITNDNPVQFGRDLKGFKEQALNVSKNIGGALNANQSEIDKALGRQPVEQAAQTAPAAPMTFEQWKASKKAGR